MKPKFKIGDRIIKDYVINYDEHRTLIGTIVEVQADGSTSWVYDIKWDHSNSIFSGFECHEISLHPYEDFQERIKDRMGL